MVFWFQRSRHKFNMENLMSNVAVAIALMVFYEPESVVTFLKKLLSSLFFGPLFIYWFSESKGVFYSVEMSVLCLVIDALFLRCLKLFYISEKTLKISQSFQARLIAQIILHISEKKIID